MLVAQLTDLHLGPDGDRDLAANRARFLACLDTARGLRRRPDLYLVTGDIADRGDEGSYRFFLRTMRTLGQPWLWLMGNHDDAERFAAAAAREPVDRFGNEGSVRIGDWRIVCVDTSMAGMEDAYLDEARCDRIAASLEADRTAPTMIAMHHPPVLSGVEWIDPAVDAAWIARFGALIARFPQVRQIVCGHAHMAVTTQFRGVPVCIAPATAPQLWPEMAPFDRDDPDGRLMVVDGQPGFALHRLDEATVTTTFAAPATGEVRLRNDAAADRRSAGSRAPGWAMQR